MPGRKKADNILREYRKKRDFARTPEPEGKKARRRRSIEAFFVIHKHRARRLHYDLRLEAGGLLKSWAVPKGPSLDPGEKRLAVRTEDHPLEYGSFEGVIPEGQYGAGTVIIWDKGTYLCLSGRQGKKMSIEEGIEKGHISFLLRGKKLKGAFSLTRFKTDGDRESWLLVKKRDEEAGGEDVLAKKPESVKSRKTIEEIAESKNAAVWTGEGKVDSKFLEMTKAKLRKIPQPKSISPMLANIGEGNLPADGWLFEPKLDGERCVFFRRGGSVRLVSRNGIVINGNYPELVAWMEAQAARDFVADGEIVAFEGGAPSFSKLQPRMQIREPKAAVETGIEVFCYLFDLLYYEGHDLTRLELKYRKEMLREVFSFGGHIRLTPHSEKGEALFRELCAKGWEGVMAKRADSPYVEKRSRDWLKFKCANEQELVICGFTEPKGAREAFGALLLGYYEGRKLVYAGKVGTGFDEFTLKTLLAKMKQLEQKKPPYDGNGKNSLVPKKEVHWLKPVLVAQIAFAEWTPDGLLRQPRFKGLRGDKEPKDVKREGAGKRR
jgi:bifunctional non-homologous end joining protein LigD